MILLLSFQKKSSRWFQIEITPLKIVFSGRLTNRKRPFDLLEAILFLKNKGINVEVIILGDGPLLNDLKLFSTKNNLNILFKGFLNQSKMSLAYSEGDIGVVCSEHDPSPKTVNEMMCCGLPIICSNKIGVAGDLVINNKTGFIYECANIEDLAYNIELFINGIDIKKFSENCLQEVDLWDCKNTALEIYKKLLILSKDA